MPESMKLRGRAWVFLGLMDADWQICPLDAVLELRERGIPLTTEELGKYCMTGADAEFPQKVKQGDFIVAGEGMGYSAACLDGDPDDPHTLAFASKAIIGSGVAAVLCESSNFTFLRNSIDHGLPVVECQGIIEQVSQGDELEVDLKEGVIHNITTDKDLCFPGLPDFILEMLEAGGLYPKLAGLNEKG